MIIHYITNDNIPKVWWIVEPLLQKAINHTPKFYKTEDILKLVVEGDYQLSVVVNDSNDIIAAIVTEIVQYPQQKVFRLIWCGGERMNEWRQLMTDYIYEGAENIEADGIEIIGRKGWERLFKDDTEFEHVTLYRDLRKKK